MSEHLNVLVLESERGGADVIREDLTRAGHTVLGCHTPGGSAFPCNAINGGGCPLETSVVDVAVDVRPRPRSQPAPLEDGVSCAIRQHIPLVIVGSPILNPYDQYATEVVDPSGDVVAACERAANAVLLEHTAAAADALHAVERYHRVPTSALVAVRHRRGALLIDVSSPEPVPTDVKTIAAARMTAAVRAIDRHARGVDVVFDDDVHRVSSSA